MHLHAINATVGIIGLIALRHTSSSHPPASRRPASSTLFEPERPRWNPSWPSVSLSLISSRPLYLDPVV
jgi:hypothetical protein